MMMNEMLLKNSLPPVREKFKQDLWLKINRTPEKEPIMDPASVPYRRPFRLAIAVFLLMTVVLFSLKPVRVAALSWIQSLGSFLFEPASQNPNQGIFQGEKPDDENAIPALITPTIYNLPNDTPQHLLENSPFAFRFPQWIPDGFQLSPAAALANSKDWVHFLWQKEDAEIAFMVEKSIADDPLMVAVGDTAPETVEVNHSNARLVHGGWSTDGNWDLLRGMTLYWEEDGLRYRLIYNERNAENNALRSIQADPASVRETLLRMAKSLK